MDSEDKLLLTHILGMDRDMAKVTNDNIYGSEVRSLSGIGCSNDNTSTNYEIISLNNEYDKHLSSVVINNVNYIPISSSSFLLIINSILNIDFRCYFIKPVHCIDSSISEICKICDSTCTCKCNCSCEPQCKSSTICLCLCNCTKTEINQCCICFCKHNEDSCKCVCICICNKDCGCGADKSHTCKELLKINLSELQSQISQIIILLYCIVCCISRIENKCNSSPSGNKCCFCICCPSGCSPGSCQSYCCCKDGEVNYLGIMSRINSVESLFNQIGTKIIDLGTLKNILSSIYAISKNCKSCCSPQTQQSGSSNSWLLTLAIIVAAGMMIYNKLTGQNNSQNSTTSIDNCEDIKNLIKNIENALKYYSLFGSRIKDIRSFVEYKINYNKSKEIISSLEKSIKCLSMINIEINNYIVDSTRNNTIVVQPNNLLIGVYSEYSIFQCYVDIYTLLKCISKLTPILNVIRWSERCYCLREFESTNVNNGFKMSYFYKYLSESSDQNMDDLKKSFIESEGNHFCICLVIKYHLRPSVLKCILLLRNEELGTLDTITKKFDNYNSLLGAKADLWKICALALNIIYELTSFLRNRYFNFIKNLCFCSFDDEKYHPYLISIILFISSLIENIWSMDRERLMMTIECLSTLYSQLESYDLSSVNDTKKIICKSVYTIVVDKDCKKTCQCKKGENCCWCVTCFNLLVMCIYLCIQFKIKKAISGKIGCDEFKKYLQELDCKCTCAAKESGLCCLLNLALSAGSGCKELLKCCLQCQTQDDCCKKILDNVKKGLCKLLLLGCCCCDDGKCGCSSTEGDVKVKCLMFDNGCTSVALVVFCKCKDTTNCCCLYNLVDKCKSLFDKICKDQDCCCKELQSVCDDLCCGTGCQDQCPCKTLQANFQKICNGNGEKCNGAGECLCKKIGDVINKCCNKGTCQCCKDKEGCCRCQCYKIVGMSLKILTRACRANVLEPYKRIAIGLLNSTKNKKDVIRIIVNGINKTTLKNIYLVKNNLITSSRYPESVGSYPGTISSVTNVKTRNWGYDTKYEHDITNDKGFRRGDGYPNLSDNERTGIHKISNSIRVTVYFIYLEPLDNLV